jgi:hypothetical protein
VGSCICGHAPEEHRAGFRECEGTFECDGSQEPCQCGMYEEEAAGG